MDTRKQKSAAFITKAIKNSLIPMNQIATTSGLTNTYIRDLMNGNIAHANRSKLIAFATTVGLTLDETDDLLTVFDRAKLSLDDIPIFIQTAKKRKASNAFYPVRDFFGYELLTLAAEQISGPKILFSRHPTNALRPEGHRTYLDKERDGVHEIHSAVREAVGKERNRNLVEQLSRYPMYQYIEKDCLKEYVDHSHDTAERKWREKHLEFLISNIRQFDNFKLIITRIPSAFTFFIKYLESMDKPERIFITGGDISQSTYRVPGQIVGYFTGNQTIIEQFNNDVNILKGHIYKEFMDRKNLLSFLESLIS